MSRSIEPVSDFSKDSNNRNMSKVQQERNVRPPFGVATKRFLGIGFHPGLDPNGVMREKTKLGPGEYFPMQFPKFCQYKDNGSLWDHQIRLEDFSRNLGDRNAHILQERLFNKSLGGPGTYDVPEELFHKKSCNVAMNVGFGKGQRFISFIKHDQPPPDSYFRKLLEKGFVKSHKSFNDIPTFEWDGFVERFKDTAKNWNLAPNRYSVKDRGDMNALLTKIVSKRGPYELFTGPRDYTTIHNHFSLPKKLGPDKYYTYPTELDYVLHHPSKSRYAKFLKGPRFPKVPTSRLMLKDLSMCYKDPDDPGPANYKIEIGGIKKLPNSKYPFNNSKLEIRQGVKWNNFPGPGRYNGGHEIKCSKKKRNSWVFKSKTPRSAF